MARKLAFPPLGKGDKQEVIIPFRMPFPFGAIARGKQNICALLENDYSHTLPLLTLSFNGIMRFLSIINRLIKNTAPRCGAVNFTVYALLRIILRGHFSTQVMQPVHLV